MREMKNSGIEWIGNIPKEWGICKIKNISSVIGGGTTPTSAQLEYYMDGNINWIQSGDLYKKNEIKYVTTKISEYALKTNKSLKIYEAPFIVIAMYGASVGNIAISKIDACSNQACCCIKNNNKIDLYFLYYWINACKQDLLSKASGGGQPNISQEKIKNEYVLLPSILEQIKIANFLDKKCSEIDTLYSDIEEETKVLEEYKKSVITEAVTKGLDPDAQMKDSGIEWIGKIPQDWIIAKINNLYELRNKKVSDKDYIPLSVTMKGVVPQLESVAKTNAHDDRKLVKKGDFVINSRSDRKGSCGISDYDGSVSLINTVMKPREDMIPNYYNWLFHTQQFANEFYKWGHGIVDDLWTTNWQDMKNIDIPFPPLAEQKIIGIFLDKKCAEIDKAIEEKNKQLEVLAEYKKSVIYEYVTGKKEVPENV